MNVGDKVICVDDSPSHCKCCAGMKCPIILGNVYVVKRLGITSTGKRFVEVLGMAPNHHKIVFGFDIARFRLLSELKENAIHEHHTRSQHASQA